MNNLFRMMLLVSSICENVWTEAISNLGCEHMLFSISTCVVVDPELLSGLSSRN